MRLKNQNPFKTENLQRWFSQQGINTMNTNSDNSCIMPIKAKFGVFRLDTTT
jgi:hypothetical protein